MSILARRGYALSVGALTALVIGCSGGSHTVLIPRPDAIPRSSWTSPDAQHSRLLYVAQFSTGTVQIYTVKDLKHVGTLTGFGNPNGVAVDRHGDLYVANQQGHINDILIFHQGAKLPFKTLQDPDGEASGIVVGRDDTVYVANVFNSTFGPGNVVEYSHGSTSPTRVLNDPNFYSLQDVGLDSHNNLYVTYNTSSGVGQVDEFSPSTAAGKNLGIVLQDAGGIEFDSNDKLVLCDQIAPAVKVFAQGSKTPTFEFAQNASDVYDLAFIKNDSEVFVSDPFSNNVYEFAFPTGHLRRTLTVTGGSPSGIAISPDAVQSDR